MAVMPEQTLDALQPRAGGVYLDATLGGGGHTRLILDASAPDGLLIATDRDPEAIANAAPLQQQFGERLRIHHTPFSQLQSALDAEGVTAVDGVLMDLGVSSRQLDAAERGFSFRQDGPLDMRMNSAGDEPSAADLVNEESAEALANIFYKYGEERHSRRIARAIVAARAEQPFTTTLQLAGIIAANCPGGHKQKIHPATRCFQALRIAVNDELGEVERGLAAAMARLAPGGRLAVITFHSLEDRIVKQTFRQAAFPADPDPRSPLPTRSEPSDWLLPVRKPLTAEAEEIARNPRARSAKLRVLQRRPAESGQEPRMKERRS
ncbi:16S rRNA (cytosine(1402)-N(4))-methyltransferase RsmH [Magnetofaba australis]|uniref:16S rRNA (cytosine(1402)-N(4))-methyltransferase RsmH n=1 Tax=Magnetofaba australis TaxID=1472297 RepID=UPI0032E383D1